MAIGKLKDEQDLERWLSEQLESLPYNQIGGLGDQLAMLIPPGTIVGWAGEGIPAGYLLCDGSAVSRENHAPLFKAIGVAYGEGDGSTTFNVPNLESFEIEAVFPETRWVIKL